MPANTRQRLTDAALRRFYRDGFRNVGIDQLLADVGISKTAFYKHFESKDDLMLAVLESKNGAFQQFLRDATTSRQTPANVSNGQAAAAERLRGLFDAVQQVVDSDDFHGCLFVNVAMEFPLPHEPAHQAAAGHKRAIEAIVRELAEQAGAADPQALAQELCLIMEGAYVTRHVTGDPQTIAIARRVAEQVIAGHLAREGAP